MSSTLEFVLNSEVEETLEWIEEMEEMGHVELKVIHWKGHAFANSDAGISVLDEETEEESQYENWEEALNSVKEKVYNRVMDKISK